MLNISIWKKPEKVKYNKKISMRVVNETVAVHMHYSMDVNGLSEYAQFKKELLSLIKRYDPTAIRSEDDIEMMKGYDQTYISKEDEDDDEPL